MINKQTHLLVFDGTCVLCNHWVKFVLKRDTEKKFFFTTMQTPFGRNLLQEHGISADDASTFLLLKYGKSFVASEAVF